MIKNHLSRILGKCRWTQTKLAGMTGIRKSTIGDLYNEITERIGFDQLDKICEAFGCGLPELLEYIPNQQRRTGKTGSLKNMETARKAKLV
jgi:putative transcriptional regulator